MFSWKVRLKKAGSIVWFSIGVALFIWLGYYWLIFRFGGFLLHKFSLLIETAPGLASTNEKVGFAGKLLLSLIASTTGAVFGEPKDSNETSVLTV